MFEKNKHSGIYVARYRDDKVIGKRRAIEGVEINEFRLERRSSNNNEQIRKHLQTFHLLSYTIGIR